MVNNRGKIDVKHLFCIAYGIHNPNYENDSAFSSSYEYIKNASGGSRLNSRLNEAFILGLYPELEEPVKEFRARARVLFMRKLDDETLAKELDKSGDSIVNKYNLPKVVKKSSSAEIKRNFHLQKMMKTALLNEIKDYICPTVTYMATRFSDQVSDFNELGNSFEYFQRASWILSGKIDEKDARKYAGEVSGVSLGLDLLQLKKEGIITENKIIDMNKFIQSKVIKNFMLDGKVYDLSPKLQNRSTPLIHQL